MSDIKENYTQEFEKSMIENAKNSWLQQSRSRAFSEFMRLGFPTLRDEAWKYTRVLPFERNVFIPDVTDSKVSENEIKPFLISDEYIQFVFVNGELDKNLSSKNVPETVTLITLQEALETHTESLEKYFPHEKKYNDGFQALNTAFIQNGYVLLVAKNCEVKKPIHILFITKDNKQHSAFYGKNIIVCETSSSVKIIEHYVGLTQNIYCNNMTTEILAKDNSKVCHIKIQEEASVGLHIAQVNFTQNRDTETQSYNYSFGGKLVRSDTNVLFENENGHTHLQGLFITKDKQHMDFHTRIDHAKAHCYSQEFYKGILNDESRGVFNGKVIVHKDAHRTDAQQQSKNLLLSSKAEIDTKPELEIYHDDVKCAHGATVGQLDENQLFYLRARGLDMEEAINILVSAFAKEMIENILEEEMKSYLEKLI